MKTVLDDVFPRKDAAAGSPFNDLPIRKGEEIEVDSTKSQGIWSWVRTVATDDDREGFVRNSFVVDLIAKPKKIAQSLFAELCVDAGFFNNTNGGYLIALAWLESSADWSGATIVSVVDDATSRVGPFRFLPETWNAMIAAHPGEPISEKEIIKPERQIIFAAIKTKEDSVRLAAILGRPFTSRDLFLARHFGPEQSKALQEGGQDDPIKNTLTDVFQGDVAKAIAFYEWKKDLTQDDAGNSVSVMTFIDRIDAKLNDGLARAAQLIGEIDVSDSLTAGNVPAEATVPAVGGTASGTLKLGKNEIFRAPLLQAGARTQIDPAALAALINAEAAKKRGVWQKNSKAPTSSAAGLTQFINSTWLQMARTRGTLLNETGKADGLVVTGTGSKDSVPASKKNALLKKRFDPLQSITAAAEYGVQNLKILMSENLIAPSISDDQKAWFMYLAHHEGPAGAVKFLKKTITASSAKRLLNANVPNQTSRAKLISDNGGSVVKAYISFLTGYINRNIVPKRFRE